jgi:hypothetical protein
MSEIIAVLCACGFVALICTFWPPNVGDNSDDYYY